MRQASNATSSRMGSLDLLRLLAALAVVFYHYCFRGEIAGDIDVGYPAVAPFATYGYLGVNLYLLHQVIGYIVLNELTPLIGKNAAFFVVPSGMLAASFVVWRFVETPMRKPLIRWLMSVIRRRATGSRPDSVHQAV
jgi:peptidoglycan/LPS O-acetylase OafA/YrhL